MKIYLDYIFLENFIINLVLSIQINCFTKNMIKKTNVVLGSIFLSLYTTIIYVIENSFLTSMFIKLIAVIAFTYITFLPKTIVDLMKKTLYYFIFSFIYIGIIIAISLLFKIDLESTHKKVIIYIISSIILYVFIKYLWKMWKSNIKYSDLTYTINISGQEIIGFVDTGNNVKDIVTNLDVIFVDSSFKEHLKNIINEKKRITININTVNNNSLEEGYIVSDICFYKNKKFIGKLKRVILCFVSDSLSNKKYSALIGYNTYVENLKGVTFC